MLNSLLEAATLGVLIVMAVSPAIFLLCIANETWKKGVSILLFIVSLAGFIGLKYTYDENPPQVNHLYNYGETTE